MRNEVSESARLTVAPLDDRLVVKLELDAEAGLTAADGEVLRAACDFAFDERHPLILLLRAGGVDVTDGIETAASWGRAAYRLQRLSGVVPTIAVVTGPVVAGPALLLGLVDLNIMTEESYAFVSGPNMVEAFTGQPISTEALGGAGTHARSTGVASILVSDAEAGLELAGLVLDHLPDSVDDLPSYRPTTDPIDRPTVQAAEAIPEHAFGSYDVRAIIGDVVDDGEFLELRASWAPNIVTALATIGGHSVGIVANQSQSLAGAIDIPASQKGARFVAWCDAFNVPLITMVDTSGFLPGKDLEWRGMIRHGAELAFAYARATVPRIGLILRKSYGGAYIVMDSTKMGNDLMLAWPSAEVAVMGAKGAVEILHRGASPEERLELEADYEARLLTPYPATERGSINAVIEPTDTRRELGAALEVLASKREKLRPRRHDNGPL